MSYLGYVVAAYAVFAVVLAWDFLVPRRRAQRQAAARTSAPHTPSVTDELTR